MGSGGGGGGHCGGSGGSGGLSSSLCRSDLRLRSRGFGFKRSRMVVRRSRRVHSRWLRILQLHAGGHRRAGRFLKRRRLRLGLHHTAHHAPGAAGGREGLAALLEKRESLERFMKGRKKVSD